MIEAKIETWMELEINREKTRVVKLNEKRGESGLSGIHVSLYDDLKGRGWQYLNVCPSKKALKRERDKLQRDDQLSAVL